MPQKRSLSILWKLQGRTALPGDRQGGSRPHRTPPESSVPVMRIPDRIRLPVRSLQKTGTQGRDRATDLTVRMESELDAMLRTHLCTRVDPKPMAMAKQAPMGPRTLCMRLVRVGGKTFLTWEAIAPVLRSWSARGFRTWKTRRQHQYFMKPRMQGTDLTAECQAKECFACTLGIIARSRLLNCRSDEL